MFLKYPVFCRLAIRLATASVLRAMPSISTLPPWSFMLFSHTASVSFTVAPIAFGLDKFFNVMTDWPKYLAPWVNDLMPGSGQSFMYVVGGVEILAGVLVALKPRYGAPLVVAWLAGIIFNLLTFSGWYDVALRDFGLLLAAATLARLALHYEAPLRRRGA